MKTNTYELEIWFFHEDEKHDITEQIEAESLEQAIQQVQIRHPYRIYHNKQKVYPR